MNTCNCTLEDDFNVIFADSLNAKLKKLDAPFFQVCSSRKKDGKKQITWRRYTDSCLREGNFTNAYWTSEKIVNHWLRKNKNISLAKLKNDRPVKKKPIVQAKKKAITKSSKKNTSKKDKVITKKIDNTIPDKDYSGGSTIAKNEYVDRIIKFVPYGLKAIRLKDIEYLKKLIENYELNYDGREDNEIIELANALDYLIINNPPVFKDFIKIAKRYKNTSLGYFLRYYPVDHLERRKINHSIDIYWDMKPEFRLKKNIQVLKLKKPYDIKDDNLVKLFLPFVSKDEFRPAMMGINFDERGVTATDSYKLIHFPGKTKYKKVFSPVGEVINEKYPPYQDVLNLLDEAEYINKLNVDEIYNQLYTLSYYINLDKYIYFNDDCYNLKNMEIIFKSLKKLGVKNVSFSMNRKQHTKPLFIKSDEDKYIFAIMPVREGTKSEYLCSSLAYPDKTNKNKKNLNDKYGQIKYINDSLFPIKPNTIVNKSNMNDKIVRNNKSNSIVNNITKTLKRDPLIKFVKKLF